MSPVLIAVLLAAAVGVSAATVAWALSKPTMPLTRCWACGRFVPSGTTGAALHVQTYHEGALGPEDRADWGR